MENKNTPAEVLTTAPVRKLVRAFITGDMDRDTLKLQRTLRMLHFSRKTWREIITETNAIAD